MIKLSPMQRYFGRRLFWYAITFVVAVVLNFVLPRLRAEDPVDVIMSKMKLNHLTQEQRDLKRHEIQRRFNLDKPVPMQFVLYLRDCARMDFGYSIAQYPKRVNEIISRNIPWTLALQIPTIIIGFLAGNILGALAAYRRGLWDSTLYPLSLFFTSVPYFCLGVMLIYFFGVKFQLFPPTGGYSDFSTIGFNSEFIVSALQHYALPFITLFLGMAGGQAIGMRSMSIYELGTDYIRYSKFLGISDNKIVTYVFRNALLPQLTGLAIALGTMVGGALLVEIVFSYPGLGSAMFKGTQANDYPIIQAGSLLVTANVLVFNFLVDVLIARLDPRVKSALEAESK